MLYSSQLKNKYSYLNSSLNVGSLLSAIVLQLDIIIQTHHHHSLNFIYYKCFTFSIQIVFNLIPSDANDPQGLIRR